MTPYRLLVLIILVATIIVLPTGSAFAADDDVEGPVVYRVQTDDNLRRIAARYGSSVEDLMRWNNMRGIDDIVEGQRLVVRQPSNSVEAEHNDAVHIVQPGETLSDIAERYALTARVIKQLNDLQSNMVFVGQSLRLPPTALLSDGLIATTEYSVKPSETLTDIARRYELSVEDLATLNDLPPATFLRSGQRLLVPSTGETQPQTQSLVDVQKKVIVDISEQRCRRFENDKLIDTSPCSTGMKNATKTGHFKVQSKLRKAYGGTWDIWMPYWLGIYWAGATENGFHGIPWNAKSGRRIWAGLVGTPATFGCVMLRDVAMKELWNWADIGTEVVIRR